MKSCIECNHRFTFSDRLKSLFSQKGYLKCPECNVIRHIISTEIIIEKAN